VAGRTEGRAADGQAIILGHLSDSASIETQLLAALQQDDRDPGALAQMLEAYRRSRSPRAQADPADHLGVSDAMLQALVPGRSPADAPPADAASAIDAALRVLDDAVAALSADPSQSRPALTQLAARLATLRKRVQQAAAGAPAEPKPRPDEPGAKPVRRLPTWGDR